MAIVNKVIIVEGKSDKKRVQQVIAEPVNIICTHGTMSIDKLDDMIESLYDKQVFVLADSDDEGDRIRNWFKRYLSESEHIFIDKTYCQVANCPKQYLAHVLSKHGFTCKVSERMLDIANEILQLPLLKIDLNFYPQFCKDMQIMSTPILLLMNKDKEVKRIYAFKSVTDLLENLK